MPKKLSEDPTSKPKSSFHFYLAVSTRRILSKDMFSQLEGLDEKVGMKHPAFIKKHPNRVLIFLWDHHFQPRRAPMTARGARRRSLRFPPLSQMALRSQNGCGPVLGYQKATKLQKDVGKTILLLLLLDPFWAYVHEGGMSMVLL